MLSTVPSAGGPPAAKPRSIEDRFTAINHERLRRIRECLTPRQQDFMDLLPLLFHTNHPLLPGYVSQGTPFGVNDFTPPRQTLAAAHRLARSFSYQHRAVLKLDIMGLYLMGSSGTIAYSHKSDFDIWLCHRPDLAAAAAAELREKASRVEHWAAELGLDVHFFVFDPDSFREGRQNDLSEESSGSSQHYLLLDEFYRSAVVIAGLQPIWWHVPPEEEANYREYVDELVRRRFVGHHDFIDFGGLGQVPAEEFFGAAVWQLYKSINSPYKSVLKLLLIEAYADEYPDIELLALRYKKAVYAGETNLENLDPYIQMYNKVEEYLMVRNDPARLQLIRRCFYLKVHEKLSAPSRGPSSWRREALELFVQKWGWEASQLWLLDTQENWKLPTVLDERRELVSALTQSYRSLSDFARRNAGNAHITQTDLHVLGRKLYAAFERKAGKIEIVNRGICPELVEKRASLHLVRGADQVLSWMLFADNVSPDAIGDYTPLKRAAHVTAILAWCHFNRVIGTQTLLSLYAPDVQLGQREIRQVMEALDNLYPGGRIREATQQDLIRKPSMRQAALFVNIGIEPANLRTRGGDLIASSRTDALSYGAVHENLALKFDLIYSTSWEEVFTRHEQGLDGLLEALCEYVSWLPKEGEAPAAPVNVYCFTPGHGATISQRLQTLCSDVAAAFHSLKPGSAGRYILEAEDCFHVIHSAEGTCRRQKIGDYGQLLAYLAKPLQSHTKTFFDRHASRCRALAIMYHDHKPQVVQSFFLRQGPKVELFVIDERGSLFTQLMDPRNHHALMDHLYRFFHGMLSRMKLLDVSTGQSAVPRIRPEFKLVKANDTGGYHCEPLTYDAEQARNYLAIRVIIEDTETESTQYTILCGDREFTPLEHGKDVFNAAARHVLAIRKSGLTYPIYITDVDLSRTRQCRDANRHWQTVQFLQYKKVIEEKFMQVIAGR